MRGNYKHEDRPSAPPAYMTNSKANGEAAEKEMLAIFKNRGRTVTPKEDMFGHYDMELRFGDQQWYKVDVKAVPMGAGKKNDDELWLELKNVRGKLGWMCGEADMIAFGLKHYWVFMDRKKLLAHVGKKCGSTKAMVNHSDKPRIYKYYSREGRDDLVTIVSTEDLMFLGPALVIKRKKGFS
jgi:hypothetical protein